MDRRNFKILAVMFLTIILYFTISTWQKVFAENTINERIANGETLITMQEDIIEDIEIPSGKSVTIDLNSHTLTTASQTGTRGIINHGNLTIMATNGGIVRNGTSVNGSYGIIDNYGTLTVEDGTFMDYGQADGSSIKNRGGVITINHGEIISNADGKGNACLYSDGSLSVGDGVSFKANSTGAYSLIVNSGIAIIGNVNVEGVKGGFGVNSGDVTIKGGSYKGNNYYGIWITNNGNTTVTINGGSFTGKYGLYTAVDDGRQDFGDTDITINGGTFTGTEKSAVAMNSKGSIRDWGMTIKGGVFSTDITDYVAEGYSVYTKESKYFVDKSGDVSATKEKIIIPVGTTESLDLLILEDLRTYLNIVSLNSGVAEVEGENVKGISVGNSTVVADLNNGKKTEIEIAVYNVEPGNAKDTEDVTASNQVSRNC